MAIAEHNIFAVQMAVFLSRHGKEVGVDNGMLVPMSILIVPVSRMKVQSGEKKRRQ